MKRIIALMIIFVLLLSILASCGDPGTDSSVQEEGSVTDTVSDDSSETEENSETDSSETEENSETDSSEDETSEDPREQYDPIRTEGYVDFCGSELEFTDYEEH